MLERAERDHLLALLAWWREAGVDVALDDSAPDWTAEPSRWPGAQFEWPESEPPASGSGVPRAAAAHQSQPLQRPLAAPPMPPRQPSADRPAAAAAPSRPVPQHGSAGLDRGASTAPPAPSRAFATLAPDAATMAAREAARNAPTLEALGAALMSFDGCSLKTTAKNLCFFRGAAQARLMLIGEAPGSEEDREGKPFVGRSGQLLDKMLAAIGLGEADVHITNTVYWRPPGNRTPTPQETLVCRPFLERQIELVQPDVIVTLGGPAAKAVLEVADGILKVRGKWHQIAIGGRTIRVMPTLHPAYLLRAPIQKKLAWRDLRAIKSALEAEAPVGSGRV